MNASDQELMNRYFQGRASDEEIRDLEKRMLADPELRTAYLHESMTEADLRSFALREDVDEDIAPAKANAPLQPIVLTLFAIAAAALLVIALLPESGPKPVGTIASSEQAGWQSEQPTVEGAVFGPGVYILTTGLATLAFDSGAEMTIKAPAKIEIISDMRVIFDYGQASFHVPDSAIGFQVDTRFGHVVDHGTKFSLQLPEGAEEAKFSVQEGEIALHHKKGEVQHLVTDEAALMTTDALEAKADFSAEGTLQAKAPVATLQPVRETTVIFDHDHINAPSRVPPDCLLVKNQAKSLKVNRRALIAFDVSALDLDQISAVRLHLNAVPSGLGLVTNMPKVSEFVLLAIPDGELENWQAQGLLWKDAPQLEQLTPVATFSLARSEQSKAITLESAELLDVLKADQSGEVSFVLHCMTPGSTLVHGFASTQHREAAGAVLEVE